MTPMSSGPRMLVLTDVGEEIDDEAALWLLHQHLNTCPTAEAALLSHIFALNISYSYIYIFKVYMIYV